MIRIKKSLFLYGFTLLFFSCFHAYNDNYDLSKNVKPFVEGTEINKKNENEKNAEDKIFTTVGNKIILYTNNKKYWSVRGYTLWKFFPADEEVNQIKLKKIEGDDSGGYGFICYRNKSEQDRFLCILIYTTGVYSVGYVVDGKYNSIVYKEKSKELMKGSGSDNIIRVKRNGKKIELYFTEQKPNEKATYVIENSDEYKLGNGGSGVIAVISPKDNFPKNNIHIEYEK